MTMYSPPFYREERLDVIHRLIDETPFAMLIADHDGSISHLPLLREGNELLGHMARANPQWRGLREKPGCRAIFQGPHAYISPAWYQPQADNVPTWNYAAAHARARFTIDEDPVSAYVAMERMVNHFEAKYQTGWVLPRGEAAIEKLMKGIVVFRLREATYDAKLKLGQKLDPADRQRVIDELDQRGCEMRDVARWMNDNPLTDR